MASRILTRGFQYAPKSNGAWMGLSRSPFTYAAMRSARPALTLRTPTLSYQAQSGYTDISSTRSFCTSRSYPNEPQVFPLGPLSKGCRIDISGLPEDIKIGELHRLLNEHGIDVCWLRFIREPNHTKAVLELGTPEDVATALDSLNGQSIRNTHQISVSPNTTEDNSQLSLPIRLDLRHFPSTWNEDQVLQFVSDVVTPHRYYFHRSDRFLSAISVKFSNPDEAKQVYLACKKKNAEEGTNIRARFILFNDFYWSKDARREPRAM